jgi:hypothetical protein
MEGVQVAPRAPVALLGEVPELDAVGGDEGHLGGREEHGREEAGGGDPDQDHGTTRRS